MKKTSVLPVVLLLFILIVFASLMGRYQGFVTYKELSRNSLLQQLILMVRLPRIVLSLVVGAGLAVSGIVMQTVFQNSLADPGILGISQAAGFGASLGFLLFPTTRIPIQVFAFISGMISLVVVLRLARRIENQNRLSLIFAGIAISAFFSAGLGIVKYLADPLDQLPSIVFWLLGSLSTSDWSAVVQIAPLSIVCMAILYLLRWRINAYSLSDSVLYSLGIDRNIEIYLILGISVLLTTTIISFSGLVGWVGLIVPNVARLAFGYDMRKSLPASILIGAIFVLFSDTLARVLIAGEIPLGIITAFLGALIFIVLILNTRSQA